MISISPPMRVSIGLVCISTSIFFVAMACRLIPDPYSVQMQNRKAFCELLAIHCSFAIQNGKEELLQDLVIASFQRNPQLLSAGIRVMDGELISEVGNHQEHWDQNKAEESNPDYLVVPVIRGDKRWGSVEVIFKPIQAGGLFGLIFHPMVPFFLFFIISCFLAFFFYVRLLLRRIDYHQSRVVPHRVRNTLDTLAEGVVILDKEGQIVMANEAFADTTGHSKEELQGKSVSSLSWSHQVTEGNSSSYPWEQALQKKQPKVGTILGLATNDARADKLSVNSMPILGADGSLRGALASFDNLTSIERKNTDLLNTLNKLKRARVRIHKQNQHLRNLATKDPLTSCLNRRAFFSEFETQWNMVDRKNEYISCLMVDIDHFKSINDNHGHSCGDQVLREVSATLRKKIREEDLLCRYGGEEFCILMPHVDLETATTRAEQLRLVLEKSNPINLPVTASFGLSSTILGAKHPQQLLEQADKALYVAKRTGRNRLVRWDNVPHEQVNEGEKKIQFLLATQSPGAIPFHAVAALLSSLSYRHSETADHSRRVADLCVALSQGLMSHSEIYVLEVAALLHEIGKLGLPDSILEEPLSHNKNERKIIQTYEAIGDEIVAAAFSSHELSEILQFYRCDYKGDSIGERKGKQIPLGARLLKIADSYDTMVSQWHLNSGKQNEAFATLRRDSGTRFDPDLVEHSVQVIADFEFRKERVLPEVSKPSALKIGVQLEKLAIAADMQDRNTLHQLANNLASAAEEEGIEPLLTRANELLQGAKGDKNLNELLEMTVNLIDFCRSTYQVYSPKGDRQVEPSEI